ncbi:hypothetical protein R1flu_006575 [Riccia fluitans]|uniref:Transmembrane protein 194A n=1 Tax=Riccia fluitans TaxID=41844 RepID=A0ABD1YWE8_9MARC
MCVMELRKFQLRKMAPVRFFAVFAVCVAFFIPVGALGKPSTNIQDVGVNKSAIIHPLSVDGFVEESPGTHPGELVIAARLRVLGISRMQHLDKFYHTYRIKVEAPSRGGFFKSVPRVEVCVHQDPILDLAQCVKKNWRTLDKSGSWSDGFSPFESKFVDVRIVEPLSDFPVVVSVHDEENSYRLVLLALGIVLWILAPVISGWVPFYYSTAMTLGVIMVLVLIVYQTMRLLPTGRKSSIYIVLYGSLVGLGTVIASYFSSLVTSVLTELGLSEEMYNPMAIFLGVGIALFGAYLGYWGVRKLIITEDGSVDLATAKFVKWAIRILGSVSILQSSKDPVFMLSALIGGIFVACIVLNVKSCTTEFWEYLENRWSPEPVTGKGVSFHSPRKKDQLTPVQKDALRNLPGMDTLFDGTEQISHGSQFSEGSTPGRRRKQMPQPTFEDEAFVSTFHKSPGHKPISKQEYKEIADAYTSRAVEELESSKEFKDWKRKNKERFFVLPAVSREERRNEEISLTAGMEEAKPDRGLFGFRRQ